MSENKEEYASKHRNSLRCETRFCAKCLSLELFKAIDVGSDYYRCEVCSTMQLISDNEPENTVVAPRSRNYAKYGGSL